MSSTPQEYTSFTVAHGQQYGCSERNRQDLIVLPGLLGYGPQQIAPLLETLVSLHYHVIPVSYVEKDWKPDFIVFELLKLVRESFNAGRQPTIFGVSLGGLLAAMLVERLTPVERAKITVIAVDAPYGARTLKAMPAATIVGPAVFGSGLYRLLNGKRGDALLNKMVEPPKRQFVEIPDDFEDPSAREAYIDEVISRATTGLTGHSFSTYGGQLAWLSSWTQPDLTSLRTIKRLLYIQCRPLDENDPATPNNNVVVQPLALQQWQAQLPELEYTTVHTDHCEFEAASLTWNRVMREYVGS